MSKGKKKSNKNDDGFDDKALEEKLKAQEKQREKYDDSVKEEKQKAKKKEEKIRDDTNKDEKKKEVKVKEAKSKGEKATNDHTREDKKTEDKKQNKENEAKNSNRTDKSGELKNKEVKKLKKHQDLIMESEIHNPDLFDPDFIGAPVWKKIGKKKGQEENKGTWDHICLISVILIFMLFLGFSKFSEEKWSKNARYNIRLGENFVDLYEVLEIDSGASSKEIKKQYKSMALLWHPDKNPGCGKKCHDKFNEITKAYEILGNEEKRKAYDQNTGVMNIIKSTAVSLTSSNFERLVLESKDFWIIQAYENGNGYCEHIAPFWEEVVMEYGSNIRFGRINVGTDRDVLRFLPFNVVILPTVFSFAQGLETEIFVFRDDVLKGLKKFVSKSLPNKLRDIKETEAVEFFQNPSIDFNEFQLLFPSKSPKTLQFLKSLAFVHQDWLKFYTVDGNLYYKIRNKLKFNGDAALFFHNKTTGKKDILSFNTITSPTFKQYKSIVDIAKYLTVPEIFRNNFREYCYHQELRNSETSTDGDEKTLPHVCVLFLKSGNETINKKVQDKCWDFVEDQTPKLLKNLNEKKSLFEHYSSFQFGFIDLKFHNRFKRILEQLENKHQDDFTLNQTIAMAIFPETKKIAFIDRFNQLDDWLADILESDSPQINLLYLSDFLGDNDLPNLLHHEKDSSLKFVWRALVKNIKDLKLCATSILLFFSLIFYRRRMNMYMYDRYTKTVMFFISIGFHLLAGLAWGLWDVKDDVFF